MTETIAAAWTALLDALPAVTLPLERAVDDPCCNAIERRLALSDLTVDRLRALAASQGASVDVAVVAALMALLARYSGQNEVAVAVTFSPDDRRIVRAAMKAGVSASRWVHRVDSARRDGVAPDLGPEEQPLTDVGVDERRLARGERVKITFGMPASADAVPLVTAADLELRAADTKSATNALDVRLVFRACRFDDVAADRIASHLTQLIEGLAARAAAVDEIVIVGAAERERILACSGVAEVNFDEQQDDVVRLFERHVERTPDAVALVDGDATLTYRELDRAASSLAARMASRGAGRASIVAVYLERGASAIVALLGILKARAIYVPVDTTYPAGRITAILESAAPALILTREALVSVLPPREIPYAVLCLDHTAIGDVATTAAESPGAAHAADDVAYAIFTSGSTGRPKGVVVDHRTLANYADAAVIAYDVRADDRVLQAASLGFDLSLEEIVVTLTAGAALVVRRACPIESIPGFLDELVAGEISVLSTTSALWHELTLRLDDGSVNLPPLLRLVILGADVARPDILAIWQRATQGRVRLVNSYGLTETTIVATVWEAGQDPLEAGWRAVPIGRPLKNVSAYVLDTKDQLVPVGIAGEICIGGLAVARRYLGDDVLTAARFVADPFIPGQRMYRTGDRGLLRASGELEFLGRSDYQIKVSGVRVELGEIESRLREVTGVTEAVVISKKSSAGETELEAHVMVSAADVTESELRAHLRRVLPAATVPAQIHIVERFPLTPAGKIDRRVLAAERAQERRAVIIAPETPLEHAMVRAVAEVLCVADVGMLDSFASLGGTSLTAVRAASILGHRMEQRVRAQLFFECQTLRDACVQLADASSTEAEATSTDSAIERDALLDPAIGPRASLAARAPLATVLLTGATGFYGTFVLADLLRETSAHVVCLVRASSLEAGFLRVVGALAQRACHFEPAVLAERVSVVVGDLGDRRLGLDDSTFEALSETVDAIFHIGARVNMVLPYEALRAMNVLAVSDIIQLATTGRPKTVHHVSTVEVLSDMDPHEACALSERPAATSHARLQEGYGQSKWVAEKLVEAARARGVRAFIHRPGRLMGHSGTGVFNVDDFLVRMLEACGQIGTAPILDVDVDITPTDYASRALVRLAQLEPMEPAAFHLVSPFAITWSAAVSHVVALGYPMQALPHEDWCSRLERHAPSSDRREFLLYLAGMSREDLEAAIHGGHSCDGTRAVLGDDVICPPVDAKLFATYLARLVEEGRFPRAAPRRSHRPSALPRGGHDEHP